MAVPFEDLGGPIFSVGAGAGLIENRPTLSKALLVSWLSTVVAPPHCTAILMRFLLYICAVRLCSHCNDLSLTTMYSRFHGIRRMQYWWQCLDEDTQWNEVPLPGVCRSWATSEWRHCHQRGVCEMVVTVGSFMQVRLHV